MKTELDNASGEEPLEQPVDGNRKVDARVRPELAVLYPVPLELAVCPECGGKLFWQVATTDGLEDLSVDCVNNDLGGESNHRYWQSDWQPIIDKVKNWIIRSNREICSR